MRVFRDKRKQCSNNRALIVLLGRTRWRLVLGHWRWGIRKLDGYGSLATPPLLIHWITLFPGVKHQEY